MANDIGDDLRKLAMAGVGAISYVAEKGREAVEELSKRGEEAVKQGQVVNEQLKHDIKQTIKENVTVVTEKLDKESVLASLESLSPEALAEIRKKLDSLAAQPEKKPNEGEPKD